MFEFKDPFVEDERDMRSRLRGPCLAAWLFIVALFAAGMATCAHGQGNEVEIDCDKLSRFASMASSYRLAGADQGLFLAIFRKSNEGADPDVLRVFEQEVRRVWTERMPTVDDAEAAAFRRCTAQLGSYPRGKES
jgi:hypothetical protein